MKTSINPGVLERGMKVKTVSKLGDTKDLDFDPIYLKARKSNTKGVIFSAVSSDGAGDLYFVRHGNDKIAVYRSSEMCEVK